MRRAIVAWLLAAPIAVGCGTKRDVVVPASAAVAPCNGLVDISGRRVSGPVRWYPAPAPEERRRLARWCDTIGPGVLHGTADTGTATTADIAIVSWNVHVGGGQLAAVIRELRAGRLTDGTVPDGFVLLLQEAFRGGPSVPRTPPADAPVPVRIDAAPPTGARTDVVSVAAQERLALFYLPSMRNGREGNEPEDRGNAILSTFHLVDPSAVELPLFRQRRVAISATVSGLDPRQSQWRLRVMSVHLDASTGPRALWLFTSAHRERQAQHLTDVLDASPIDTVVGADLNTWAGGTREPAFIELRRRSSGAVIGSRFAPWFTLDYVFFRLPSSWETDEFGADSSFGSDHRPVVTLIKLRA